MTLTTESATAGPRPIYTAGLEAFQDLVVRLHTELGRTRVTIRDFLALGPGSVLELPVAEGEYITVYANGLLIARGEIIIVEGTVGVRITEVAA